MPKNTPYPFISGVGQLAYGWLANGGGLLANPVP